MTSIEMMLDKMGSPNNKVETIKDENKTIYFASNTEEVEFDDMEGKDTYIYLYALIVKNNSKQAISFEMEHTCFNSDKKPCRIDFKKEKEVGMGMLKSIKFK